MPDNGHFSQGRADAPITPLEPTLEDVLVAIEHEISRCPSPSGLASVAAFGGSRNSSDETRPSCRPGSRLCASESPGCNAQLESAEDPPESYREPQGRGSTFRWPGALDWARLALTSVWKVLYEAHASAPAPGPFDFPLCSATPLILRPCPTNCRSFIRYANEVQFTVKPRDLHKQVARCWNRAQEIVAGWPQIRDGSRFPPEGHFPLLGRLPP